VLLLESIGSKIFEPDGLWPLFFNRCLLSLSFILIAVPEALILSRTRAEQGKNTISRLDMMWGRTGLSRFAII
jgi:hypothetical protein